MTWSLFGGTQGGSTTHEVSEDQMAQKLRWRRLGRGGGRPGLTPQDCLGAYRTETSPASSDGGEFARRMSQKAAWSLMSSGQDDLDTAWEGPCTAGGARNGQRALCRGSVAATGTELQPL